MIKVKNTLEGKLNVSIVKEYPELENITVTPTLEEQKLKSKKYGFGDVIVEGIPVTNIEISPTLEEQIKEGLFNKVKVEGIKTQDLMIIPKTEEQKFTGLFKNVIVEPADGSLDTSDATATAEDILLGKTAYVNGEKVVGSFEAPSSENNAIVNTTIGAGTSITSGLNKIIKKIPDDLVISVTDIRYMFFYCSGLTELKIDTSNVETTVQTFAYCTNLETLEQLNASKFKSTQNMFMQCNKLQNFGGLFNLGKGFDKKESYSAYHKMDLSYCTKLTHESLMNIINNLYDLNLTYDVANGGTLYTQSLVLGSTNLAKLTTAEEIEIATLKGWTVS